MKTRTKQYVLLIALAALAAPVILVLKACTSASGMKMPYSLFSVDTPLTDAQKRLPDNGLRGLTVAEGMKVETMATEPMLINPTNIEVDEKGRVWVCEAYNYRFEINNNKAKTDGDRILILEDKDGDGRLETSTVFYQGPEVNAPLGVCVLKDKVIVSQSPYVWAFYDDNGDSKADRKEILFQGIGGVQHDHGMHTFTSGPDGKLYFNFGNEGKTLLDKNNKVVLDQDGDEIGPKKYKDGMLFRSDPDGTNVECIGYNFRNPYEPAIDSYGTIWQSDNDDDGNKGTRINYVMEHGNFGFKDEMTGATWRTTRINLEDSIPFRHWHLNDPGVVPNLLQTGQGSPTGMLIYEGSLLPAQFQNQMIHTEPGRNVVRSYPVTKVGAGYSAAIVNLLTGDKDQWFRPADVCVAPDGSLIVADWYDPGVGGHRVVDLQRGRIYRVTPKGANAGYKVPVFDYTTPEGATAALQNPNLAVRRIAFAALVGMGKKANSSLEKLWRSSPDPRMRARALWVLSKSENAKKYISEAIKDANPDLRITGIRAAKQVNLEVLNFVAKLVNDTDPQVRREAALALRHNKDPEAAKLWASLAVKNDGTDRWYLEALGIGADRQWDTFLAAYLKVVPNPLSTAGGKDIVWRARTDNTLPYLAQLASDSSVPMKSRLRYFRAFDFLPGEAKSRTLTKLLEDNYKDPVMSATLLKFLTAKDVANSPIATAAVKEVLKSNAGTQEFVTMVRQFGITTESAKLLDIVATQGSQGGGMGGGFGGGGGGGRGFGGGGGGIGADAARLIFEAKEGKLFRDVINGKDATKTTNVLTALGSVGNAESLAILTDVALSSSYTEATRKTAVEMIGRSTTGETTALELLRSKKLPAGLIPSAVAGLSRSRTKAVVDESKTFLPNTEVKAPEKAVATVSLNELLAMTGNITRGKAVYAKACFICHQVNKEGLDFGPNLSEIGTKLPKEGLYDAIISPSAGVSFGYETWQVDMKDGSTLVGIISSRTESELEVKYPGGALQKHKMADVKLIKALPGSMMPAKLNETMTKQEFADLLEYLAALKKK